MSVTQMKRLEDAGWLKQGDTIWNHANYGQLYYSDSVGRWYLIPPKKKEIELARGYNNMLNAVDKLFELTERQGLLEPISEAIPETPEETIRRLTKALAQYADPGNWKDDLDGERYPVVHKIWIGGGEGFVLADQTLHPEKYPK